MVREVWEKTCMDKYSDQLCKYRNKVKKTANSTEYEDLRSHEPRGMKDEIWNELIDIWKTLEWKKSDAGRKNRVAHHNAMVHTGGSRSFGQHKRIMVTVTNCLEIFFSFFNKKRYSHILT